MKHSLMISILAVAAFGAAPVKHTGVITDTMCGKDHAPMGVKPDAECVRQCVRSGGGRWKYALLVNGRMYVLSDQQTPERFAAQKVVVTGALYEKTEILRADRIEAAK